MLDTGILYAYYDRSDSWHQRALRLARSEEGGLAEGYYFVADLPREQYARVGELNLSLKLLP